MGNKVVKNILIVARQPVGGIRTYFGYVYSEPLFDSYRFTLITPNHSLGAYLEKVFQRKEFKYVETQDSNSALIRAVWKELRSGQYDLLHTHGFTSGILSAPLAKVCGIPHIMTAHDVLLDWQFVGWKGALRRASIGLAFRLIDIIMAVGDDAKANLAKVYPNLNRANKLVSIRNGIDVERFSRPETRNLKMELGLPDQSYLFGFFGRFMSQKGFRYLVNAIDSLRTQRPDINFAVAAFGWGGFIREEQQALRERGLEKWFHFMPHTDDMPAAIRGVDAVVMPSLWEACPLLPMEAMVAGTPVIASDCIGLKEVTEETPAIRFAAADENALLKAIETYIANQQSIKLSTLQFAGTAAALFDSKRSAEGLNKLYESVLATK